ncbi:hypothetical protein Q5752_000628 [Cryptotrichosporon argae]
MAAPAALSPGKPQLSITECDRLITAPGSLLEMDSIVLDGRSVRVWKNLPPTFHAFLVSSFDKYADRPFISSPAVGGREQLAFRQVYDEAAKMAAWMRSHGVVMGSRVAIAGHNCTRWVVSFVAAHLLGAVPVFINASLPLDALVHCLSITRPLLVLLDADLAALLGSSRPLLKQRNVGHMYCWDLVSGLPADARRGVHELGVLQPPGGLVRDVLAGAGLEKLGPDSDAVIFFTSGTGGFPKAVLSTQRMALSNIFSGLVAPARAALRAGRTIPPLPTAQDAQRTVLLSIPLFHVTGCLSWLMRALFGGSRLVLMHHWSVRDAVKLVLSENVNVVGGVPAVIAMLLQSNLLPPHVKVDTIFYGGASPAERLASDVKRRWPLAGLVQGYGMTETNAYVCSIAGADYLERPGSTGPPVPICDVRIVDPTTRQVVPAGQAGLLLVRGPQVMKAYYGDEEATMQVIDQDGWLDTGDLASVDQDGFVYIRDRLKDVIIRGGENIPSAEVENAFYADARIAEAAAVAVPDVILGERVGVAITLRAGVRATECELLQAAKSRLRHAAWPAVLVVHPGPLPRNVNGKVMKKEVKAFVLRSTGERMAKL